MSISIELSIVICTRNRAGALPACLEALSKLRSDRSWEVLIVDNASTDETADVLARSELPDGRLRVVHVDRIGLGHARDAAWREARGEIVAFTDDDCYVASDYVDAVLSVFDEDAAIACVGGRILLYDPSDVALAIDTRTARQELVPYTYVRAGSLQGASLSFRRSALASIGGVDTDFGAGTPFPCEDIDMVAAAVWQGCRVLYDPGPCVWHHHGRKLSDVRRVMAGYDRGRGAYYAKYVIRPDSRQAYLQQIFGMADNSHSFSSFVEKTAKNKIEFFWHQYTSAAEYCFRKRRLAHFCFWLILFFYILARISLKEIIRNIRSMYFRMRFKSI